MARKSRATGIAPCSRAAATIAARERVLALGFDGACLGQHVVALRARDAREDVLAARQRARLVEEDDVDEATALEAQTILDEDSAAGCERGRDRDHERDREPERVRARDHEHGHRADHGEVDVAGDRPDDEGRDRGRGGDVEEECGGPVGEGLGAGARLLRLRDEPLDTGERRLLADGRHADADRRVGRDGAGGDVVALGPGPRASTRP